MALTSTFCRAQGLLQRERASVAQLENVRMIATRAAIAWENEASLAEKRENKLDGRALPLAASPSEESEDRFASENPDRGQASAPSATLPCIPGT